LVRFDIAQNGGLDSAVGKIEMGASIFGPGVWFYDIVAIAVLDLRDLEFHGVWVAVGREAVDDGASRIAECQKLGYLVECLSGGVVARVADIRIGPEISFEHFLELGEVEMCVSSGDNQCENGELEIETFALALLEQHSMNVSLKMIDGDQWLIEREGEGLGKADADQQSPCQSRTLGDCDGVDGVVGLSSFRQRLAHDRNNRAEMLAGGKFWNHSTIGLMGGDLGGDDIRKDLFARAHHGRARFVARALDAEDGGVRHNGRWAASYEFRVARLER